MKTIVIKTQAQMDKLPNTFKEWTEIKIRSERHNVIYVRNARENSTVTAWENSTVTARENSTVTAWENSTVTARENSTVTARENSTVTAWGNSTVTARGNSTVTARENSTVTARENSTVTARENSTVTAWGNSTVTARGNVCIHIESDFVTAFLFGFAVAFALAKAKIAKKSKTCTVINPPTFKTEPTFETYENHYPVDIKAKKATFFKAVHKQGDEYVSDYDHSFKYEIGKTVKHEVDKSVEHSCSVGLHVSHLDWAKWFGSTWSDLAILECEVPVSKIIVARDCDGKVRTSELKVIREVQI